MRSAIACITLGLSLVISGCSNLVPGPYIEPPLPDGGGSDGGEDMGPPDPTTRLVITPSSAQRLEVMGGTPVSFTWRAYLRNDALRYEEEVTDTCSWAVIQREGQRTSLGSIVRGQFTSGLRSAGAGKVRAERGGLRAEAELSLLLTASRLSTDDDNSAPPMDAASRFPDGALDSSKSPRLLYPPSGAMVPANLGGLVVQWVNQGGTNLYEARFDAELLRLRIYTTSPRRLTLTEEELTLISDAGIYGPVSLQLRGGNTTGLATYGQSETVTLRGTTPVLGATYYFATARADGLEGIWRHGWQSPHGAQAVTYLPSNGANAGGRCVGCHALAQDGGFLSMGHDRTRVDLGSILNVRLGMRSTLPGTSWMTSAVVGGGAELVLAGGGVLKLVKTDGSGGTDLPVGTVAGTFPAMPAVSPDGQRLVFVRGRPVAGFTNNEAHLQQGSLHIMEKQNDVFSAPTELVGQVGNESLYYPAISPDGKWVIYNRITPSTAAAGDSYDNLGVNLGVGAATSGLYVVPVDKSRPPRRLDQANDVWRTVTNTTAHNTNVRNALTNSMPSFLPTPVTLFEGGIPRQLFLFIFASRREYGVEIVRTNTAQAAGNNTTVLNKDGTTTQVARWNQQLWMAAFDPQKAAAGEDPSSAALRLPFQSPLSHNYRGVSVLSLIGDPLN